MNKDLDLPQELPYMSPLTTREDASKQKGFSENFEVESATKIMNIRTQKTYAPNEVNFVNYYRFEGMTDPGDSNILYEIETSDGLKGILVTPYGPDCPAHVADFVATVDQITKQHAGSSDAITPPQHPAA